MNDFRPETFTQFVRKTKPIWFVKIIWAFAFVLLVILFFWTYKTDLDAFWHYLFFFITGLTIQALFFYSVSYEMYILGRQAYLQLNNEDLKIISDAKVYIRGFDLFSKKRFFDINIKKPIYDFDQAELLLANGSLILLGYTKQLGSSTVAAPVEITVSGSRTSIAHAKLIAWQEKNNRVIIEIEDDQYPRLIKIEFKNYNEEIKSWLIKYSPNQN